MMFGSASGIIYGFLLFILSFLVIGIAGSRSRGGGGPSDVPPTMLTGFE